MQQEDCFMLESPKEKYEISEEELFQNIFPSKIEKIENFDEINMQKLYYLNNQSSQKAKIKNNSTKKEEALNEILLIDDYEAVFNKLESNEDEQGNDANVNDESSFGNEIYEKEDYNKPSFVKNVVSENKCFFPMMNDNIELIIKVEEPTKKNKNKNNQFSIPEVKKNKIRKNHSKKKNNIINNQTREKKKRGPYKKKSKKVEQINTEDICFPFSSGKGLFNGINPVIQLNQSLSSIDYFSVSNENDNDYAGNEQSFTTESKIKKSIFDEDRKEEENFRLNAAAMINTSNDINWWKFTTKKYFIGSDGKKKRVKKKRKFKPDDIRKKIKARFHKTIKNIINENLKKAGSKELFDFLPQSFIGNVSKKLNSISLELTFKEILSTDFSQEINSVSNSNNKVDNVKFLKNQKVLKYLEENPEILKRSGFDLVQNLKYKDLLKIYFISAQFEKSINQLKDENESKEYIQEYIYRAKTYIKFYSNYENTEEKRSIINYS